ncbi:MAG: ABC transporter ATP-binding protein [Actinomycetota bacterium]|nr:ABC transporter ATP-binding protein [Actinomycetota bacterium]
MAEQLKPDQSGFEEVVRGIPVVDARAVRKAYETGSARVEALRGVDFIVARGEMVAVIGPSGCGKTTLLNCLSGLDDIDAGDIHIDGVSLRQMSDNDRTDLRGRRIGFVFQAFNLLPILTAEENVELPLLIAGASGRRARRAARAALERVGLGDACRRKPVEMSGGEQQRVAIARAVVHAPSLLFADEPTGSLDSDTSTKIIELLESLNADGQTIVLVTHNAELSRRAGRIVRMADGRVTS